MTKYYAVKKGRKAGVYLTWPECQEQVIGYKGAIYKSFDNMSDAHDFINNNKLKHALSLFYILTSNPTPTSSTVIN